MLYKFNRTESQAFISIYSQQLEYIFHNTKKRQTSWMSAGIVESPNQLSNKFIEDLRKIHDYITYFHIDVTRPVNSKIS